MTTQPALTQRLHFAQISDIHFSSQGDHHDMLSARAGDFLAKTIAQLNQLQDLDFVLITGDLFDTASREEFALFQKTISSLQKPYHIIPGNHDRREKTGGEGLTRQQFAQHFNPQFVNRPASPHSQAGYWSMPVAPNVQLIGLDSIRDEDWGGLIDEPQITWLQNELVAHAGKLIIVAVHHPLHVLAPIDRQPGWTKFVCDNGPELMALFDQHPQVKVVLTGHHHITRVDKINRRLHLACPAMVIYPCAYRTFRLTQETNDAWHLAWFTHSVANEETTAEARQRMLANWLSVFPKEFVAEFIRLAFGSPHDRTGEILLN